MGVQPEVGTYDATVYSFEITDPVQGGIGGIDNAPLLNLANRTGWLKAQVLALQADGYTTMQAVEQYATGTFEPLLNFTPVQQGTGVGQTADTVKIGWSAGSKLKATVNVTDLGNIALESWVGTSYLALIGGTVTGAVTLQAGATFSGAGIVNNAALVQQGASTFNGIVSLEQGASANGTVITSGQFSSNGGLITSGEIECGITINPNPAGQSAAGLIVYPQGTINSYSTGWALGGANGVAFLGFYTGGSGIGAIFSSNGSVSYSTTSDERTKVNLVPLAKASERLADLAMYEFNHVDQVDSDTLQAEVHHGGLAHEIQAVVPHAVVGQRGATETVQGAVLDPDGVLVQHGISREDFGHAMDLSPPRLPAGSRWVAQYTRPIYQQVDYSKLIPLLITAMQEQMARLTTLERQVTDQAAMIAALQTPPGRQAPDLK